MNEETVLKAEDDLWLNHPRGAGTFHPCSKEGCEQMTRGLLCDDHILEEHKNLRLCLILDHIIEIRRIEAEMIDGLDIIIPTHNKGG